MTPSPDTLESLLQQFAPGTKLLDSRELTGGFSASMTALDVQLPSGDKRKLVVRLHGPRDLGINPDVALDQFRLLQALSGTRLPVPAPLHLDQTSALFDQPVLVLEYVEGTTDIAPTDLAACLDQLAEMLARIHKIDPVAHDLKFLPSEEERNTERLANRPRQCDETLQESRIREALTQAWPMAVRNPSTLLHGDYWTGNVLWQGTDIVAVIDWENALVGDPVEDLGNARMELNWSFGLHAMDYFTRQYLSLTNIDAAMLPWWDLMAALRPAGRLADWANTQHEEEEMRKGHGSFVEQAMQAITSR